MPRISRTSAAMLGWGLITLCSVSAVQAQIPRPAFMLLFRPALVAGLCAAENNLMRRCFEVSEDRCRTEVSELIDFCAEQESSKIPFLVPLWKTSQLGEKVGGCVGDTFLAKNLPQQVTSESCINDFAGHARSVPDEAFEKALDEIAKKDEEVRLWLEMLPGSRKEILDYVRGTRRQQVGAAIDVRKGLYAKGIKEFSARAVDEIAARDLLKGLAKGFSLFSSNPEIYLAAMAAPTNSRVDSPEMRAFAETMKKSLRGKSAEGLSTVSSQVRLSGLKLLASGLGKPVRSMGQSVEDELWSKAQSLGKSKLSEAFTSSEEALVMGILSEEIEVNDAKSAELIMRFLSILCEVGTDFTGTDLVDFAMLMWQSSQIT